MNDGKNEGRKDGRTDGHSFVRSFVRSFVLIVGNPLNPLPELDNRLSYNQSLANVCLSCIATEQLAANTRDAGSLVIMTPFFKTPSTACNKWR